MTQNDLSPYLQRAKTVSEAVDFQIATLSKEQLNWRPNAKTWSIGQIINHLMVSNECYFAPLQEVIAGKKISTFWEKLPFWVFYLGENDKKVRTSRTERKKGNRRKFFNLL